jgi:hypothetical protein
MALSNSQVQPSQIAATGLSAKSQRPVRRLNQADFAQLQRRICMLQAWCMPNKNADLLSDPLN